MRVKTIEKRQEILNVASQAFQELGFEGTSMSEICTRVGGSKATIYNYFSSKEELFFEVMYDITDKEFEAVVVLLSEVRPDMRETLLAFGKGLLKLLYSPDVVAARRMMIAESGRSDLGRRCFERGPKRAQDHLAIYLFTLMQAGKLEDRDPHIAARHLLGLLESEIYELFMLKVQDKLGKKEMELIVTRAVDVFMAGYGRLGS